MLGDDVIFWVWRIAVIVWLDRRLAPSTEVYVLGYVALSIGRPKWPLRPKDSLGESVQAVCSVSFVRVCGSSVLALAVIGGRQCERGRISVNLN